MAQITRRVPTHLRLALLALFSPMAFGCTSTEPTASPVDRIMERLAPAILIEGESSGSWTVTERMTFSSAPGVAVSFVDSPGPVWSRTVGVREAGTDTPLDPDTRFIAKSLAKSVTAFATLRLVDEGVLDLDAPLDEYLERWTIPDNEFTARVRPTLRQLLAHRAGFTMWGVPSYRAGEPLPSLVQALNGEAPAAAERVTIDYEPGSRSRYSGGGYTVLQLLLEDVTGESFPALMERLVLEPLQMDRSLFYPGVPAELESETATGHDDKGNPIPGRWEALVQLAAGGLITTAPDLSRFVAEVMSAFKGESVLLSQATALAMLTDHGEGRGLGFEVAGAGEALRFSHTGSGDGFRALMLGLPARSEGMVVLVNADGNRAGELRNEIMRSVALAYDWPGLQPEVRSVQEIDPAWYRTLLGVYEYSDGSLTTVSLSPAGLEAAWGDAAPSRLLTADSLRYFTRSGESFRFAREGDIVVGLEWSGPGWSFEAQRQR